MGDLSNWDYAKSFSGVEIAALILGFDPRAPDFDQTQVTPVFREVDTAYYGTYLVFKEALVNQEIIHAKDPEKALRFVYESFKRATALIESLPIGVAFKKTRNSSLEFLETLYRGTSPALADSAIQAFSRKEVARWVRDNGIKSVYSFDLDAPVTPAPAKATTPGQDKPLSKRERTTYLNTIAVLVELMQSPRPDRDSEAAIIREMLGNYSDLPGISKRKLEDVFRDAKQSMKSA